MRAPSQRRALGALFTLIALALLGVAYAAFRAGTSAWPIAFAAVVLGAWMGTMAFRALGRR